MGYDIGIYNKEDPTVYDFKDFSIGSINTDLLTILFGNWFPASKLNDMKLKDSTSYIEDKILKTLDKHKEHKQYKAVKNYINISLYQIELWEKD